MIIVGNGTSLLDQEYGARIDSFDEVLRFNEYRVEGFERHVGTKTTIWFNVINFPDKKHPLILRPYRQVYLHSWIWEKDKCDLWRDIAPLFSCPVEKISPVIISELQDFAGDHDYTRYSTGLLAIWMMLKIRKSVTICGFDWWEREAHHYSDDAPRGTMHDPQKEFLVIEKLRALEKLDFLT